jgi:hypothetical protein
METASSESGELRASPYESNAYRPPLKKTDESRVADFC